MNRLFTDHGIGVGLRPAHYHRFLESKPSSVNWVEVITENFMKWGDLKTFKPLHNLEKIRREVPVALHGVSLSIGSADELNWDYLKALKELKHNIEPLWVSDHLCWTGVNGENLHDLLPLPYTESALNHVVDKIRRVQDFLQSRILIENVSSYVSFKDSEMAEWEFIDQVARRAECGLLLDVNNVFVSAINHGFDPQKYIDQMPTGLVGQIHLAGHTEKDGYLIDTHDAPVRPEVWDLYRYTLQTVGLASSMIERDDNIPEWYELELELKQAQRIYDDVRTA